MTIDKSNEVRRETDRKGRRETHDIRVSLMCKDPDGILVSSEEENCGINLSRLPFGVVEDHNEPGTFYSDPAEAVRLLPIGPSAGDGQRMRVYSDNVAATKFVLDRLYKHK